jgi:hypothetical protein
LSTREGEEGIAFLRWIAMAGTDVEEVDDLVTQYEQYNPIN